MGATLVASSTYRNKYSIDNVLLFDTQKSWWSRSKPAHINFNFAHPVTISGFRVMAAKGDTYDDNLFKDYKFQVISDEGWKTVIYGQGDRVECCEWQELDFQPVTSYQFRLSMMSNWGKSSYIALSELQLRFNRGETI